MSIQCKIDAVKEKSKKTLLKKFGVDNYSKTDEYKKKYKASMLKKFGVEYPSQDEELFNKQQVNSYLIKLHKQTGLCHRGTYEKHFLDFCFENNIPVKKGKTIKYSFEGSAKTYFSDFYLEKKNLIIEIKSDYTYIKDLNKNLSKQKACLEQKYNFIFIINKDYTKFKEMYIKEEQEVLTPEIMPKESPTTKPSENPEKELTPDKWPEQTPLPNPKA